MEDPKAAVYAIELRTPYQDDNVLSPWEWESELVGGEVISDEITDSSLNLKQAGR